MVKIPRRGQKKKSKQKTDMTLKKAIEIVNREVPEKELERRKRFLKHFVDMHEDLESGEIPLALKDLLAIARLSGGYKGDRFRRYCVRYFMKMAEKHNLFRRNWNTIAEKGEIRLKIRRDEKKQRKHYPREGGVPSKLRKIIKEEIPEWGRRGIYKQIKDIRKGFWDDCHISYALESLTKTVQKINAKSSISERGERRLLKALKTFFLEEGERRGCLNP